MRIQIYLKGCKGLVLEIHKKTNHRRINKILTKALQVLI